MTHRSTTLIAASVVIAACFSLPQAASGRAVRGLEGVPRFAHIVMIVEENEAESTTFRAGSPAHYLNYLRTRGVFLPDYYGTGHASLPNYIAMVSGQREIPAEAVDCLGLSLYECAQFQTLQGDGRNLGDQLDAAHISWKSYMDSTPEPCFHGPYFSADPAPDPYVAGDSQSPPAGDYADRHNPFIYFPDFVGDQTRCVEHQRPFTELKTEIATNSLPQFSFITPDTCHDGHDNPCSNGEPGGLVSADAWLEENVPSLLHYLWHHNGLLVINFDEGTVDSNDICPDCASGGVGGRTGAVLLSPELAGGVTVTTDYDHYSLLRTIEDSFGIAEHLNLAAQATPMTEVFSHTAGGR